MSIASNETRKGLKKESQILPTDHNKSTTRKNPSSISPTRSMVAGVRSAWQAAAADRRGAARKKGKRRRRTVWRSGEEGQVAAGDGDKILKPLRPCLGTSGMKDIGVEEFPL
jgi:hypothetical protein